MPIFLYCWKEGGLQDTRGTLIFEILRLAKARQPKILLGENVKGLLNHEGGATFGTIIRAMDALGYDVEWQVLNSKNYGVPQNRERVYIIGHLRGSSGRKVFPIRSGSGETTELQRQKTGAIIEGEQQAQKIRTVGNIVDDKGFKNPERGRVYSAEGLSPTLQTQQGGGLEPKVVVSGLYTGTSEDFTRKPIENISRTLKANKHDAGVGISVDLKSEKSTTRRGMYKKGYTGTLDTDCYQGITDGIRIRKLTPKECWRLQGFHDELFERAEKVNSDSQLYKQAGNSVTVNVVYEIGRRLYETAD